MSHVETKTSADPGVDSGAPDAKAAAKAARQAARAAARVEFDKLSYWDKRKNNIYLRYVDYIMCALSDETKSIIDVGSRNCPYLDWFPWAKERVSLDLKTPYKGSGVRSIKTNFLTWEPDKRYDVVLCLQVLEHVPPVEEFAAKLLEIGRHVIVSVPYKWPETAMQGHVHDPIDRAKFLSWFPRRPDYMIVAREPMSRSQMSGRLVAYFDTERPGSGNAFRRRSQALSILAGREPVSYVGARKG